MKRIRKFSKEWGREIVKQDFFPHEKSNGVVIMVSLDGRYYYEPEF